MRRLKDSIVSEDLVALRIKDQWSLVYDRKMTSPRLDENSQINVYVHTISKFQERAYEIFGDGSRNVIVCVTLDKCSGVKTTRIGRYPLDIHRLLRNFKYQY
jgi:hypothetical protein